MTFGPVMLDIAGTTLAPHERERLRHPAVGGVILFTRNYESPEQLAELTHTIRAARARPILIGVDHEGGRVQRFRAGFSALPAAGAVGRLYAAEPRRAVRLAEACGWLMARELRAVDVDFSFAPVLDLDRGISRVIGDRSFHAEPDVVATLAHAFMTGMSRAGMAATGKHFPGHGGVEADSHVAIPVDERDLDTIRAEDWRPFVHMIEAGLAAVMPAHVIYPRVDAQPAGFSRRWLQDILRTELKFGGVIFSDDLSMEGAKVAGGVLDRAHAALGAGCDMILVCNDPDAADTVLNGLGSYLNPAAHARLGRMQGRGRATRAELVSDPAYMQALEMIAALAHARSA